jgi:UDP-N-acetylglucosamine diphosphorylase/glucosamine-1-phosphate N-acetyltransferase
MNYVLFDDDSRVDLLPLTFTRPVAELRLGIFTIKEKWDHALNAHCSYLTEEYLRYKFGFKASDDTCFINGGVLPDGDLVKEIKELKKNQSLFSKNILIAARADSTDIRSFQNIEINNRVEYEKEVWSIRYPWQLFMMNNHAITTDFKIIRESKKSKKLSSTNMLTAGSEKDLFIEEGATIEGCQINTFHGPVYIGKDAEVMEGCLIRGPFALCEGATLKMGAKMYGATTIGPHCKVGGEVNNSILMGYSNKAHDGFIGNSVIGEWCNLGADTNNSNLKNNYGDVKMYSYRHKKEIPTGLQFCGVVIGDHTKTGINTMFNTGTVAGVSANVFGSDFPPRYIPSFSWGGAAGFSPFILEKAIDTAKKMYERRSLTFDAVEQNIFEAIFKQNDQL